MHAACGNVTNPSMTDSECSQTFFLRITLASFAFRRCSLAISRRYPLISHSHTIGPIGSGGREAAFLVRAGCGSPVPGVADSTSVRWRVFFNNVWCICSYYAPHAGLPQETRVSFWRDFVVIAGDANVWHPHFNLSRSRSCDVPIIPFWDLLMASCRLDLCNPPDRATHISGAGLDCIFISSGHVVDVVVRHGLQCCTGSPVCCPVLGSDHFLCVAAGLSLPTRQTQCVDQRCRHCVIGDPL